MVGKRFIIVMTGRMQRVYKLVPPLLVRDIRERYAGSKMGILWAFLQPLMIIVLYWLVFSQIMQIRIKSDTGEIPFIAFLLTGLLPWLALQDGVMRGASSILEKRQVIKKVIFPAELFPLSAVASAFVYHAVGMVIFFAGFFVWKGDVSLVQILAILALLSLQILIASGLSLLLASLSVYVRDIGQVLGVAFQMILYLSPILYPLTSVPERMRALFALNPVTVLTESYHNVVLYGRLPQTPAIFYLTITAIVSLYIGAYSFRKLKRGFADVL